MQRVEKTVMVPTPKLWFIAFDGKEFEDEIDCLNYEHSQKVNRVDGQVERCRALDDYAPFDGGENYESHSYRWYKPKSKEDLDLLCDAFGDKFPDDCIGQWVCVETTDYDGECWVQTVSECIDYANSVLGPMGYEVTIKAKENS